MITLTQRVEQRLRENVCPVCVHRTADGGCTLAERHTCPVFEWMNQLIDVVHDVKSDRLSDYLDQIRAIVCPECAQDDQGRCADRNRLDCPLDLYLGIVVEILEEVLSYRHLKN